MSPEPGFSQKSPLGFYSAKAAGWIWCETFGWVCREIRAFFQKCPIPVAGFHAKSLAGFPAERGWFSVKSSACGQ
jgi:hypothetical protein